MCVSILAANIPVHQCVPGAHGGRKASDPLEQEFETVVNCHTGAGS